MITTDDTRLSKTSYADKDFASIYPDLLDLAKELTTKWDPSLSNESDPGVVLIKAGAFLADHLNYNIDKNTLERFLPSATQDRSVRTIVETNGYTPEYYISATGDITFSYTPETETAKTAFTATTIPEFTFTVSNEAGDVTYTQCKSLTFSNITDTPTAKFIQGRLESLTVNSSETILLENIDSNNRLYFPTSNIAQNGVYIKSTSNGVESDYWEKVDYLLTQPKNTNCYKVDYDSQLSLPYIEFPSDIANIIGSGLKIKYIVTTGKNGNVSTKTLNVINVLDTEKLPSWLKDDYADNLTYLKCNNLSSITNGKDPETLDEMYQSFKKVVGTFNTLVTCEDYSNAIYEAKDNYDNPFISNGVVTDIKTDYNKAIQIPSFDEYDEYFETAALCKGIYEFKFTNGTNPAVGDIKCENGVFKLCTKVESGVATWETKTSLSYKEFASAAADMSPYDLTIYALKAMSMADYTKYDKSLALNNSFIPADQTVRESLKEDVLEDNKCITHTFNDPTSGEVYTFNNFIPLNITVVTYNKVEKEEKDDIENNICKALTENFNARKIDFGEELDYDAVLEVLNNADERIKSIRLEDFTDTAPKAKLIGKDTSGNLTYTDTDIYEGTYPDGTKLIVDIVAKNVLAGRLCLFDFDEDFTYTYNQSDASVYPNVATISSQASIALVPTVVDSTSASVNKSEYSYAGTYITLELENAGDSAITINGNGSYRLPIPETDDAQTLTVISDGVSYEYTSTGTDNTNIVYTLVNTSSSSITLSPSGGKLVATVLASVVKVTQDIYSANTALTTAEAMYTIKENEYITVAYPNYATTTTYPTYCNYRYVVPEGQEEVESYIIPANVDTTIQSGCYLYLQWTSDSVAQSECYQAGDVVKTDFNLYPTASTQAPSYKYKKSYKDHTGIQKEDYFCTLSASEHIYIRELLLTQLVTNNTPCYWIMTNGNNDLFNGQSTSGVRSVILGSGEYFIYSNEKKDTMVILGAGTKIYTTAGDTQSYKCTKAANIESITEDGYNASISWQLMNFANYPLNIQELELVTLSEGDTFKISYTTETTETKTLTNTWQTFYNASITYTFEGESAQTLPSRSDGYLIRSRLDLDLTGDGQALASNQTITITYNDGTSQSATFTGCTVQSSTDLALVGDTNIDISNYYKTLPNFMKYAKVEAELEDYIAITDTIKASKLSAMLADVNNTQKVQLFFYNSLNDYELDTGATTYYSTHTDATVSDYIDDKAVSYTLYYKPSLKLPTGAGILPTTIENVNGKYTFSVGSSNKGANLPFAYNNTVTTLTDPDKVYIIPIYLDNVDKQLTVSVSAESSSSIITDPFKLREYASDTTPGTSLTINTTGMYLVELIPQYTGTLNYNCTLSIMASNCSSVARNITVYNPVIVNGINEKLESKTSLAEVVTRMKNLVASSTKPDTKIYWIKKPDNSMAIQDCEIDSQTFLYDKNNVINNLLISQIDIDNSDIEIHKSMRNY